MILAGADKLIGKEDRATLESDPSALSEVKQSAPVNPPTSACFASQSANSRQRRNEPALVSEDITSFLRGARRFA